MAWRPAKSLEVLKGQLDSAYSGWLFLGFLGDQAHASVPSDHNPNSAGVVTALDIGGGGGLKIHELANNLASNPHPDLKYIISNRRIAEWQYGFKWHPYSGSDPHDTHIHVSVGRGADGQSKPPYDDTNKWNVTGKGGEMPITKEQEKVASYLATGSYPGVNYDYRFTGTTNYDGMFTFWAGQQSLITKEQESEVADEIMGINGVIGWDGYNSQFVGKPVVSNALKMTKFWVDMKKQTASKDLSKQEVIDYLDKHLS